MQVPAVSVLANAKGQVMLFIEGDWGVEPPTDLVASAEPSGTTLWKDQQMIGVAQTSAMPSFIVGKEFFLGEVRFGKIHTVAQISLHLRQPVPTSLGGP